jgi:NDP-sugar pyrophosphorylase family protein
VKIDCQAVILAGGLGTRMRPVTETIPKPMIPVCGKPFLQHQLELLRRNGIERVLLLVSYLGEQIEQYFGKGDSLKMEIGYSYESSPLGTGGALKNAISKLEEKFLLLNGDTFLDVDYPAVIADFMNHKPQALIVARKSAEMPVPNNLAVSADRLVTAYQKRNPENMTCTDAGAIVLARKVLDNIAPTQVCSLEEEVFPKLIKRGEMRAWVTPEPFFDMGSPAGLNALSEKLA